MQQITSKDNKLIKYIKGLKNKKNRDESATYFIEGIKMSMESLEYVENINYVVICPDLLEKVTNISMLVETLNMLNIEFYEVTKDIFISISDMDTPQGILVVMKKKDNLAKIKEKGVYILLDDVQDPGNVGTILRIADAISADGFIMSSKTADVYSPKVLRSSMGAIFRVPILREENLKNVIRELKAKNIKLVITSLKANQYHYNPEYPEGVAVVIGNESKGISEEVQKEGDIFVKIPMVGGAESLNASVAAGIMMYEVIRKKYK